MLYLTEEWDSFDAWCLLRGIEADVLTSRQLVTMVTACLTEGLDKERRAAFLEDLESIGRRLLDRAPAEEQPIPDAAPPPGWKSDRDNWAGIQAALGGMSTMKKAVSR